MTVSGSLARSGLASTLCILTLLCALPASAVAQGKLQAATQNMRLAVELCLRDYREAANLPYSFHSAGFQISGLTEEGTQDFEAPGIFGSFSPVPDQGYCYISSTHVPLAMAEEIGQRVSQNLFPGLVEEGGPEQQVSEPVPLCDGLSIFAPRQLIRITYSAAGNSGDCVNDGTSAIAIKM